MRAAVLSIGDELIFGQRVDTNSAWLSQNLAELGFDIIEHVTVNDSLESISEHLKRLGATIDVLVVTGGLGPTEDDLTREALADVLGVDLILDQGSLDILESFFTKQSKVMPERNKVQAMIPVGCDVIPNPVGTAPGMIAQVQSMTVYFFPGVPNEMKTMFEESVKPVLSKKAALSGEDHLLVTQTLGVMGVPESVLAERLGDIMARAKNPIVNCTASSGVITIRINSKGKSQREAENLITPIKDDICQILNGHIFSQSGETMAEAIVRLLIQRQETIALAESCTGGLLAKLITDVAGSSDVLYGSWVSYSNDFKSNQLGVDEKCIEQFGAVSPEVCKAMALRARELSGASYSIAITGIAGPGGGSEEKPVGLVYIGYANEKECRVDKKMFLGDREMIRNRSANLALGQLWLDELRED